MISIEVSRRDLAKRYEEMSIKAICKHYGISSATLYVLLDNAGIPRKLPRSGEAVWPVLVD